MPAAKAGLPETPVEQSAKTLLTGSGPAPATANRRIRVFISSTFRDMIAERDELMTHTWPELRRFCQEYAPSRVLIGASPMGSTAAKRTVR